MIQWISRLFSKSDANADLMVFGGKPRSPQWRNTRAQFLEINSTCEACSIMADLEVHHIQPYHLNPELELKTSNLMTMCRDCHFHIGHLRDWGLFNPNVREDARLFLSRFKEARKRKVG